jgi:DNA replication protein DnaC
MKKTQELSRQLKKLLLPVMSSEFAKRADVARAESLSYEEYLQDLVEAETESRSQKRFARWLKESTLPPSKSFSSFDMNRLPIGVQHQSTSLLVGQFVEKKENVLFFGTPGSGKTHLMCALGQEMLRKGYRTYGPVVPSSKIY